MDSDLSRLDDVDLSALHDGLLLEVVRAAWRSNLDSAADRVNLLALQRRCDYVGAVRRQRMVARAAAARGEA